MKTFTITEERLLAWGACHGAQYRLHEIGTLTLTDDQERNFERLCSVVHYSSDEGHLSILVEMLESLINGRNPRYAWSGENTWCWEATREIFRGSGCIDYLFLLAGALADQVGRLHAAGLA